MHQVSGEQPRNHDERQHRRKFQKSGQRSNEPKSSENPGKRGKHIKVLNRAECAAKACRTTPLPQIRLKKQQYSMDRAKPPACPQISNGSKTHENRHRSGANQIFLFIEQHSQKTESPGSPRQCRLRVCGETARRGQQQRGGRALVSCPGLRVCARRPPPSV